MNTGGPVWHASARHRRKAVRRAACRQALSGVGHRPAGEWFMDRPQVGVYHLRRRLSDAEFEVIGPVIDIRGTQEAEIRARSVFEAVLGTRLENVLKNVIFEELGLQVG